jgi:hypothetical protein
VFTERHVTIAVCALVALSAIFIVGRRTIESVAARHEGYKTRQQNESSKEQCYAKLRALKYEIAPKGDKKPDRDPDFTNPVEVCSQIRSADAGDEAAFVAREQFYVSLLNLFFVVFATGAAGAAAYFTHKTAVVTRIVGQQQSRAYVTVPKGGMTHFTDRPDRIYIEINVLNSGVTPAYGFKTKTRAIVAHADKPPLDFVGAVTATPHDRNGSILGPGQEFILPCDADCTDEELRGVLAGTHRIYCWARIEFVDAYNQSREIVIRCINARVYKDVGDRVNWSIQPHSLGYQEHHHGNAI